MKDQKQFNITIKGKVQGVFFRKSTAERAHDLNLKGFVENRNDGSVYIKAVGDEQSLRSLLDWCYQGPPRAEVSTVNYKEADPGHYEDFTVRR